jgi:hypothetical protein
MIHCWLRSIFIYYEVYLIDIHVDDDDCIWVRNLMTPMHLGLINGPFVPHIKITGAV